MTGARAGLVASLAPFFVLGACAVPAPLSVSGTLPPPATSFAILGDDAVTEAARPVLVEALGKRGNRLQAVNPDRFVTVTFADRPLASGSFAGTTAPASREAPGWTDAPRKSRPFGTRRREARLVLRFSENDGKYAEERVATETRIHGASPADVSRLVEAAVSQAP